MTEDHYKRLVAMLLDTVTEQANRLEQLEAQLAAATADHERE